MAIITVQVDDNNGGVETSSVNILILKDGSATTKLDSTSDSVVSINPTPIPLPSATPIPLD